MRTRAALWFCLTAIAIVVVHEYMETVRLAYSMEVLMRVLATRSEPDRRTEPTVETPHSEPELRFRMEPEPLRTPGNL